MKTGMELEEKESLEAAIRDLDPKHCYEMLRSIAARCEDSVPGYNLRHDVWKVMSYLQEFYRSRAFKSSEID